MSNIVGLDGRPLDDGNAGELVTPSGYMENLGRRSGMSLQQREFLKRNLPQAGDAPPQHMSKSQRTIAALQQSCMQLAIQNMQLWGIVGAFAARASALHSGDVKVSFTRPELDRFSKPEEWPVVLLEDNVDGTDQVVVVKLGEFKGVGKTDDAQLPLPLPLEGEDEHKDPSAS